MQTIHIVAITGSLREGSLNRQLAQAAADCCRNRARFTLLDYADVPFMDQDIEFPPPVSVSRVRDTVAAADGIWFFTPEYNHYFPGVLKNLIDWLSRPAPDKQRVLSGKPAAISGVTPGISGTGVAQDHLVTLISLLNMRVMNTPRLTIPHVMEQVKDGKLELTDSLPYLQKQAEAFLDFIGEPSRLN